MNALTVGVVRETAAGEAPDEQSEAPTASAGIRGLRARVDDRDCGDFRDWAVITQWAESIAADPAALLQR